MMKRVQILFSYLYVLSPNIDHSKQSLGGSSNLTKPKTENRTEPITFPFICPSEFI